MAGLARAYAEALAQKDYDAVTALMKPDIDFRGMTPRKIWESEDRDDVVSRILCSWFEDSDHIEELLQLETDEIADCERVGYRFRVTNPDGSWVVEQQAYVRESDGQIDWMRVMCSGYRPLDGAA
jgi:hypothetical protein